MSTLLEVLQTKEQKVVQGGDGGDGSGDNRGLKITDIICPDYKLLDTVTAFIDFENTRGQVITIGNSISGTMPFATGSLSTGYFFVVNKMSASIIQAAIDWAIGGLAGPIGMIAQARAFQYLLHNSRSHGMYRSIDGGFGASKASDFNIGSASIGTTIGIYDSLSSLKGSYIDLGGSGSAYFAGIGIDIISPSKFDEIHAVGMQINFGLSIGQPVEIHSRTGGTFILEDR